MSKSKGIFLTIGFVVLCLIFFFLTKSFTNLAFAICAFGAFLMELGEMVASRIIMIIGAIGVAYFGFQMIISVIGLVI